jgi:hypothetical protein
MGKIKQQDRPNKAWVLTREHNEYDQHGEYFVAVFSRKPTHAELASVFSQDGYFRGNDIMAALAFIEHLLTGGGQQKQEDTWYNLAEVGYANS